MAIAYDAVSNGSAADTTNVTSLTWAHTCTGSDRILFVGTYASDATDADRPVSGITYNGVALTKIRSDDDTGTNMTTELWYLIAPATGANNIVVSYTGTNTIVMGGAVSYTGVAQTTPIEDHDGLADNNAAGAGATVTTVADNSWVVAVVNKQGSSDTTVDHGGDVANERLDVDNPGGTGRVIAIGDMGPKTPAGNVTMSWSEPLGTGHDWCISVATFKPAVAAGGSVKDILGMGIIPWAR